MNVKDIQRIPVKHMYVYLPDDKQPSLVYVYVLSDTFDLYFFQTRLHRTDGDNDKIYFSETNREYIKKIFENLDITKDSSIAIDENIKKNHPISMYLYVLKWSMWFNLFTMNRSKPLSAIFRRYPALYKATNSTAKTAKDVPLNTAWDRIRKRNICPWIDDNAREMEKDQTYIMNQRARWAKIVMFYLTIRGYFREDRYSKRET